MSDQPAYIAPAYLAFTPEQREACQNWHDANDEDDQHVTTNQRAEIFRRTWSESERLHAAAAAKLRDAPPCARCGARAGEPCKSIAHEVGKE